MVLRGPDERWRTYFPNKAKSDDGIARRVGRSPERSEGSSRSKRRAALGDWRKLESPAELAEANAAGLLRADGRWKAQRGRPGGVQRGPRRGGSP